MATIGREIGTVHGESGVVAAAVQDTERPAATYDR
jgi:hypothetical protein